MHKYGTIVIGSFFLTSKMEGVLFAEIYGLAILIW